jgi:hypothetical protein
MPADWFVNTRGRSAKEDYSWFSLGTRSPADADAIAERGCRGKPWYSLIHDEKPGLLLYDDPGSGTVLVVTGLASDAPPLDYQHRPIRAALLGAARPGNEVGQRELIGIAVSALRGEVATNLPVRYGPARGVELDAPSWERFAKTASGQLTEDPDSRPAAEFQPRSDTAETRRRIADSLSTVYLRSASRALASRLIIIWTPIVSLKDVIPLNPWRAIAAEFVDPPENAKIDWAKVEDAARTGAEASVKVVKTGVKAAGEGWKLAKWIAGGGTLAVIGLVVYLLIGTQPPTGWQVADTVTSPANGAARVSIAPLGPSEALGAWISSASGQVVVEHWDTGTWTASLPLPGQLYPGRYDTVKVGTGSAGDAWVYASTRADGGHSYALHWDDGTLSGPVGDLPQTLVVTAADGPDAAGTVQLTVVSPPPPNQPSGSGTGTAAPDKQGKPGPPGKHGKPKTPPKPKPKPTIRHVIEYVRLHWDGAGWQQTRLPAPPGGGSASISGIADSGGHVWVTVTLTTAPGRQQSEVLQLNGAAWKQVTVSAPGANVYTVAPDGTGGLWLGTDAEDDLYHYQDGHWTPSQAPSQNGQRTRILSLAWLPEEKSLVGIGTLDPSSSRVILAFDS